MRPNVGGCTIVIRLKSFATRSTRSCLGVFASRLVFYFGICSMLLPGAGLLSAQSTNPLDIVNQMARAEVDSAKLRQHFAYKRTERSTRTKDHLWVEAVVETSSGRMHRLLSLDGRALTPREKKAEDDRIQYLVQHPDEFRKENQTRKDDEAKTTELLNKMAKMYLFSFAGSESGCTRINFVPNPQFQEQTYQDRVIHGMAGYLLVSPAPAFRLCKLDASLQHPVEFGYGLLGKVSQGSSLLMDRLQVSPGQWKTSHLVLHVDGNILLLKSVSRQEDSMHSDFKQVPYDLSIQDAAKMVNSAQF